MQSLQKYQKNGQKIFDTFCSSSKPNSIMFPKAPEQTYVDIYPGPEQDKPGSDFSDERQHQADYEAEVSVYRALEGLEKNLIVLHSFKYTHGQSCPIRNRKKCNKCRNPHNTEGESDFLVLGPNYCVTMEVKNMSHIEGGSRASRDTEVRALVGTFNKSLKQREKIESLIKSFDPNTTVLQFTAYPNFSKSCKGQFQENAHFCLSDDELSTIIFKEVISAGSTEPNWWEENVTSKVPSGHVTPQVRNILLAMWCTEKEFDQSKCSLGRCIVDVDKRLREGHITLQTKKGRKRDQNPEIFIAPPVIKNNIGVANLTAEQNTVFHSSESLMWINGPAGAGKSVLLCGKMIQLAQGDNNNKVVLFRQRTGKDNNTNKLYENALDKASVQYQLIEWFPASASDKLTSSLLREDVTKSQCNVTIVEIKTGCSAGELTRILSELNNCHVFIDDIQQIINYNFTHAYDVSVLLDKLLELSLQHSAWVACDVAQWWSFVRSSMSISNSSLREFLDPIVNKLSERQVTSLSMNLRNTRDISDVLCVIRDMFVESASKYTDTRREFLDMILPKQLSGHFIHGPKITFHILNDRDQLSKVLNYELDKLTSADNNVLNNSDICIVYNDNWYNPSFIKETVETRCSNTDDKIALCNSRCSYSAEWPAVVVLTGVTSYSDEVYLRHLYLTLSRARVYCSVIIYPEEEGDKVDNYRVISRMLDNIKDHSHIVRH